MHGVPHVAPIARSLALVVGVLGVAPAGAAPGQLPLEPVRERGNSVTGAFEGWYRNPDGTFTLLVGYYNRNSKEVLEIPIGPANRIEPGGPDLGQPTTFQPRRVWGVFTIVVPADFGGSKYTWSLTAGGETSSIPLSLHPAWEISPFKDPVMGNTPPTVKFSPDGPVLTGPPRGMAARLSGSVNDPVTIEFWVEDKSGTEPQPARGPGGPGLTVSLHKFRGPGDVIWERDRPAVGGDGKVTAIGRFSRPGDYVVRVQLNDASGNGGGGFQCCWTNVLVQIAIK